MSQPARGGTGHWCRRPAPRHPHRLRSVRQPAAREPAAETEPVHQPRRPPRRCRRRGTSCRSTWPPSRRSTPGPSPSRARPAPPPDTWPASPDNEGTDGIESRSDPGDQRLHITVPPQLMPPVGRFLAHPQPSRHLRRLDLLLDRLGRLHPHRLPALPSRSGQPTHTAIPPTPRDTAIAQGPSGTSHRFMSTDSGTSG